MTLILNDIENELNVSEERVIEYATNRVKANPEDGFDIPTNLDEARSIIRAYGEEVLQYNIGDKVRIKGDTEFHLETLAESNFDGSSLTDLVVAGFKEDGYILKSERYNIEIFEDKENHYIFFDDDLE